MIPEGVHIAVTRNYGETANHKANELLFHLGLATVSIVILIAFAIGWREALVTLIVIPTTILLTLFASRATTEAADPPGRRGDLLWRVKR